MDETLKSMHIKKSLHQRIKILATMRGIGIRELVSEVLEEALAKSEVAHLAAK